ncbi:MAG: hypothetical protein BroJett011_50090 [Chloroflexota bacterium]|nr:MAG: hypothetical protein BroJett011_50090 [Chloroflexota bacterium]
MSTDTIPLEIGLNTITSYKRLAYTPWHAIAEFVDNSTQSFYNNEAELRRHAPEGERPLTVRVEYDRDRDYFSITDNAMGMSLEELKSAMFVARPPVNTTGRSKYGMGLKTAASWIGNLWKVRTKKLGQTTEYTLTVDVEVVAAGNNRLDLGIKDDCPPSEHYTIIEIGRHNRKFHTKTLSKIGDYLSSMYREDFRKGILSLFWKDEMLTWREIDEELLRDREEKILQDYFDFTIPSVDENGNETEKKVVGWVGVLREGSRSKAGFSILHSGRVIKGWPEAWRPESLYGQIQGSNDLINQRLVGEIHLDDFDVSHTKDDILWLGDEEDLVQEQLRLHCGNFREIARTYRRSRDDERGPTEAAIRTAVDRLRRELRSPEIADLIGSNPLLPESLVEEVVEAVRNSVVGKFPETFTANIEGIEIRGYIDEMSVNDPYLTIDTANATEIIIIVNASHPHWNELKGSDGVLNYLRHCTYDGIAEAQARDRSARSARINPNTVKLFKDRLLRIPLEIEQNSQDLSESGQIDSEE